MRNILHLLIEFEQCAGLPAALLVGGYAFHLHRNLLKRMSGAHRENVGSLAGVTRTPGFDPFRQSAGGVSAGALQRARARAAAYG